MGIRLTFSSWWETITSAETVRWGKMTKVSYYQVGGSVRDTLLGLPSKDIDYAVEAPSFEAMAKDIEETRGGKIFLSKPEYLTIRAMVDGVAADFVLCRKDGAYYDGRRPENVTPGTIYDDLARRDFTVNAIAIDEAGNYIDPHGGRDDLELRLLKCVGKADDRFNEDGLRLLRALRFAITKNLFIGDETDKCLRDPTTLRNRLQGVSVERVREELHKCFAHDTWLTLRYLEMYHILEMIILKDAKLWLKPTLETR